MKIASNINPLINAKTEVVSTTEETTVLGLSSLALRDNIEGLLTVTIETRKFVGAEQVLSCAGAADGRGMGEMHIPSRVRGKSDGMDRRTL